jgi:hypothetical protein
VHREHDRPRVDPVERLDQLLAPAAVAVRVVEADVRVRVERLEPGDPIAHAPVEGQDAVVRDHGRGD